MKKEVVWTRKAQLALDRLYAYLHSDVDILQAIRTLLQKTHIDPVWQDKLTRRAQQAEQDIQAGRFYSREQVVERTNGKLS